MKDREIELAGAKAKSRKNEEVRLIASKSELKLTHLTFLQLLSTIESSVQCQICMDLPERPFAYVVYSS